MTDTSMKIDQTQGACGQCQRRYGDQYGFPDLVIPDDAWRAISPRGNEGGLLCPSCICLRLHQAGIKTTGRFESGPLGETRSPDVQAPPLRVPYPPEPADIRHPEPRPVSLPTAIALGVMGTMTGILLGALLYSAT